MQNGKESQTDILLKLWGKGGGKVSAALAVYLALRNRPDRIRVKDHEDWPDYVPERTCVMKYHFDDLFPTESYYQCSECGGKFEDPGWDLNYCPSCGAKVRKSV